MLSTTPHAIHTLGHHSSRIGPTGGCASQRLFTTLTITGAKPNTCGSYSTTPARAPTSLWVKDTPYSRLNCAHGLARVRNRPSTPFDSAFSRVGSPINLLSIALYDNWETPSSKERYYSSDTSPKNYRRLDKKSSTCAPKFDTRNRSRCWLPAPLPLPAKLWTLRSNASNKPEPIAPSTRFYFAKPFGMSVTMKRWSTCETTSTANCRQEDNCRPRVHPSRVLHLPISLPSWHGSTTHPCVTCTTSRSSKTEGMTMITMSEVAVFTL